MSFPPNFKCVVIAGMGKTGTTLPLTLLDGHPGLLVMPEELRFFHLRCDGADGKAAADRLFADGNTQMLAQQKAYFDPKEYMKHGGTGFGARDYSDFDFPRFESDVRAAFEKEKNPADRFWALVTAFKMAKDGTPPDENTIFVCKAPHNEGFAKKWDQMLGKHGRYIICTRLCTEHYISLSNIDKFQKKAKTSVLDYVITARKRFRYWSEFPDAQTYVLGYDRLVNNSEGAMREICGLIGVEYHEALNLPTKMGVPWSGNSSRGIVKEKVFKNEHKAPDVLSLGEIGFIEHGMQELYKIMKWNSLENISADEKRDIERQISMRENAPKEKLVKLLKAVLPQPALEYLQDIDFRRDQKRRQKERQSAVK